MTPADASPRLWPEPRPKQSPGHRCSHFLALDQLLGKITEPAFLNLPLSGEKRDPFLLRPRAPGSLPWLGAAVLAANPRGPCLCGWLLSEGPCAEACGWKEDGEVPISPCLKSPHSFWHFLAGLPIGSGLAEMGALLQDLWVGHCSHSRTHRSKEMTPGTKRRGKGLSIYRGSITC